MPGDLPKMVQVQRPDGSVVLVPEFAVERMEKAQELRRPGDPDLDAVDFLLFDPVEEQKKQEIKQKGKFDADEFRHRDAFQSFQNVADNFSDPNPPERQPFTAVREGIANRIVDENPSESDFLSEADLRLQDLRRKRALGLL